MPLRFSSVTQDRTTHPNDSPSEPTYDSIGDDSDDGDGDDDDPANTEYDSSKEEREDQLDQDDPGNFRDSIYDSFQKSDCMPYRFVCWGVIRHFIYTTDLRIPLERANF